MANNRLFIMHMPSKVCVYLGKRMASGWYDAPDRDKIQAFYDWIDAEWPDTQDQLTLAFESHPYEIQDYREDLQFLERKDNGAVVIKE